MFYHSNRWPLSQVLVLAILIISTSACSEQKLPITSIYASNSCGFAEKQIRHISSTSELSQFFAALPYHFPKKAQIAPAVDFETEMVILYALGQRPNNGYRIEQYEDFAIIQNRTLLLPLRTQQPDADRLYGEMITTPCQFFTLPKKAFSTIITDSH
jgi:hypothetical protein